MAKLKTTQERKFYRKFHIPGGSNLQSVKLNTIFITRNEKKGYSYEHEKAKFDLAWECRGNGHNFITEAERKATEEEKKEFKINKKIVDFVNLTTNEEYEIIHKHENHKQVEFYRKNGVIPIIINPMICTTCLKKFPKKNNLTVCTLCKKIKII